MDVPDQYLTPEDAEYNLRSMQDKLDRQEWDADHSPKEGEDV